MDERINLLFCRLQDGDQLVFDEFYELTKRKVYFSIYAIVKSSSVSEDIMQDTYVKLLENLQKIDPGRNVVSYLITIGKNLSIDYIRKNSRVMNLDAYDNYLDVVGEEEKTKNGESDIFRIMKEVLNDNEFGIVVLHVVDEMSHREIAKHLNKPIGTISWTYNNAMKKIRKRMERENDRRRKVN